jgi:hypothetical protein
MPRPYSSRPGKTSNGCSRDVGGGAGHGRMEQPEAPQLTGPLLEPRSQRHDDRNHDRLHRSMPPRFRDSIVLTCVFQQAEGLQEPLVIN